MGLERILEQKQKRQRLRAEAEIEEDDLLFIFPENCTLSSKSLNENYFSEPLPQEFRILRAFQGEDLGSLGLLILHLYTHMKNIEISK